MTDGAEPQFVRAKTEADAPLRFRWKSTGLAEWLNDQPLDVCHWMGFRRWPPKKDCFRDLLMKLDPAALEQAVRRWITQELRLSDDDETLQAVSFDGKTLRGSLRDFSPAVHLLAALGKLRIGSVARFVRGVERCGCRDLERITFLGKERVMVGLR